MRPFAARTTRDVIRATGPEALTYLQGQLSQDVAPMSIGGSTWSLLLEPNGKVTAWLRVVRLGEWEIALDTDPGAGEAALARLERFRLRTKCELALYEGEPCIAVRGVPITGAAALPIEWPGVDGYDLVGNDAEVPEGLRVVDAEELEVARISAGVPVSGVDITEDTIPAEAGAWLIESSVSFTKGCYTGQELVARVDSRGSNVPKPLRRIRLSSAVGVPPRTAVLDTEGATVGHVTSAATSSSERVTLALGPVSRSFAVPGDVVVAGVPGTAVA